MTLYKLGMNDIQFKIYTTGSELGWEKFSLILNTQRRTDPAVLGLDKEEYIRLYMDTFMHDPVLVGYDNNTIAIVISFGRNTKATGDLSKIAYIRTVYTFPNYRRLGLAYKALSILIEDKTPWWALIDDTNIPSLKIFCALGFLPFNRQHSKIFMGYNLTKPTKPCPKGV